MVERDIAARRADRRPRPRRAHERAADRCARCAQGKARGVKVTCEVAPHHFTLTDDVAGGADPYDTNTKMNPPLREAADRDAMLEGIADGSVDVIATDHAPHHYDEKNVEFDRAPFGIVGLETAVPLVLRSAGARRADRAAARWSSCCRSTRRASCSVPGGTLADGRGRPTSPCWRRTCR